MRLSRSSPSSKDDDIASTLYIPSTAVFLQEVLKLIFCVLKVSSTTSFSPSLTMASLLAALDPYEVLKLSVPSALYLIQNNLLYLALTKLDATTYQVTYQLKILTTALFSVLMIPSSRAAMTRQRWSGLLLLTLGVCLAQSSTGTGDESSAKATPKDRAVGMICVATASVTSGFAGVYFEMVLKGSKTDLWARNIQMGAPSVAIGLLGMLPSGASWWPWW
ncbi:hypothetical protein TrRE_jg510 [Triparma retinervis]|uniref:UDP-galactose transporter n=1 Tax=Triparma retinervis TaxID=2557542 RepID=A0A9W7AUJ7_9STRA|nr:hypothetical protein TrRE_jg510 [Triparma retinervis]